MGDEISLVSLEPTKMPRTLFQVGRLTSVMRIFKDIRRKDFPNSRARFLGLPARDNLVFSVRQFSPS